MRAIHQWWKDLQGFSRILFVSLCVMMVLNVIVIFNAFTPANTDNALTGYSEQVALGTVGDPADAVVRVGDLVEVRGERCNSSGQTLEVTFSYSWKLENSEEDIRFPSLSGTTDRAPGCSSRTINFPMPAGVIAYAESAGKETTWHVEGLETPMDDEGNLGRIKYWESTPFTVEAAPKSE